MSNDFYSKTEKNNYVKRYLEKHLAQYGGFNYVYAVINKANADNIVIISDLPDHLVANYLSRRTQNIDPVVINALSRVTSFSWDENLKIRKIRSQWTMKNIFTPIKPYNIISGYAFVLHDHKNNLAILSLYIDKYLMDDAGKVINKNKNEIHGLLIDIHDMLLHAYRDNDGETAKKNLTTRESDILYLCTIGKTYAEISDLLNISASTVKFHMANVTKKMGVKNAKHAISLAAEQAWWYAD